MLPPKLSEFIRSTRLTQWFSVPSVMALLARTTPCAPDSFPHLRRIIWCGEVMANAALAYWMQRVPQATFTNLYGPTEATIASSYYRVVKPPSDAREAVPIGEPCPGEELLILDDELGPVPLGDIGHLYIGGVGLSPGYWQDDAKTREAFLPDPRPSREGRRIYRTGDLARVGPDGLVYFLGRQDSQVKTRGHRVELGEIEAALAGLEGLKEFAVVGVPSDGFEGTSICCAYARLEGADADASTLSESLARSPAELHAAHALARAGITSEESKRQGRPAAHRATPSRERRCLSQSYPEPLDRRPVTETRGSEAEGSAAELAADIQALLLDHLDLRVRSAHEDLIESSLLDSLALVELLFELERRFEIDVMVEELEIENFRSVERIAEFVASRRAQKPTP